MLGLSLQLRKKEMSKEGKVSLLRGHRAISPVIATVILIAVAVAIGLAVSFWASGLTGTMTKFEKLEMRTAYASSTSSPAPGWNVSLGEVNTGTTDITITSIIINGKPYTVYTGITVNDTTTMGTPVSTISILTGKGKLFRIFIPQTAGFINGQTVELSLQTASGTVYPREIVLLT